MVPPPIHSFLERGALLNRRGITGTHWRGQNHRGCLPVVVETVTRTAAALHAPARPWDVHDQTHTANRATDQPSQLIPGRATSVPTAQEGTLGASRVGGYVQCLFPLSGPPGAAEANWLYLAGKPRCGSPVSSGGVDYGQASRDEMEPDSAGSTTAAKRRERSVFAARVVDPIRADGQGAGPIDVKNVLGSRFFTPGSRGRGTSARQLTGLSNTCFGDARFSK